MSVNASVVYFPPVPKSKKGRRSGISGNEEPARSGGRTGKKKSKILMVRRQNILRGTKKNWEETSLRGDELISREESPKGVDLGKNPAHFNKEKKSKGGRRG